MSESNYLHQPLDFERLPEFRLLCGELGKALVRKRQGEFTPKVIEAFASFLWNRLYVELAYQAKSTNRPGYLTKDGRELFLLTVGELFGEDCDPVELLCAAKELRLSSDGEWYSERFARLNGHLAGDFVKREVRGANASALVRNQQHLARVAAAQIMLLPENIWRRRDGTQLNPTEIQRVTVMIITLDNCLKLAARTRSGYTEGLIADAAAVLGRTGPDELKEVYLWVMNHRELPALPKTTEQILRDWETVTQMAKS